MAKRTVRSSSRLFFVSFSLCHSRAKRRIPDLSLLFSLAFSLCHSEPPRRRIPASCVVPSGVLSLCHSRAESAQRRIPVFDEPEPTRTRTKRRGCLRMDGDD